MQICVYYKESTLFNSPSVKDRPYSINPGKDESGGVKDSTSEVNVQGFLGKDEIGSDTTRPVTLLPSHFFLYERRNLLKSLQSM